MTRGPLRLAGAIELMDQPGQNRDELESTLRDLAWLNRFSGGTRAILHELDRLLPGLPASFRVLDVGTGYADVPRAIVDWARARQLLVAVEAVDRHPEILALARRACDRYPEISLRQAEALHLPHPDDSVHLVVASLLLHHMEGDEPVRLLRELYRVASHAVVVADLVRGRARLAATALAVRLASRNRLIRHDGPISIQRAFLPDEAESLARAGGWSRVRVRRRLMFRLVLTGEKG